MTWRRPPVSTPRAAPRRQPSPARQRDNRRDQRRHRQRTQPVTANAPSGTANVAALMSRRFRGFLPVVVDVETGGFHSSTDALLEIAAVLIDMEPDGTLKRGATHSFHVKPFEGARLDPAALAITGIDPFHPLRPALPEKDASVAYSARFATRFTHTTAAARFSSVTTLRLTLDS